MRRIFQISAVIGSLFLFSCTKTSSSESTFGSISGPTTSVAGTKTGNPGSASIAVKVSTVFPGLLTEVKLNPESITFVPTDSATPRVVIPLNFGQISAQAGNVTLLSAVILPIGHYSKIEIKLAPSSLPSLSIINGAGSYSIQNSLPMIFDGDFEITATSIGVVLVTENFMKGFEAVNSNQELLDSIQNVTGDSSGLSAPSGIGLLGHWSFEDGSGDQAVDSTMSGFLGYLGHYNPGGFDPGWNLNGILNGYLSFTSDFRNYVKVNRNPTLDLSATDFTIAFWVNSQFSGDRTIIGKQDLLPPYKGYSIYQRNTGGNDTFRLDIGDSVMNYTYEITPEYTFVGSWHHVVFTLVRNSINGVTGYFDSQSKPIALNASTISILPDISNGSDLYIGNDPVGGCIPINKCHFDGFLDDVRFYDRALTPTEVVNIFYSTP